MRIHVYLFFFGLKIKRQIFSTIQSGWALLLRWLCVSTRELDGGFNYLIGYVADKSISQQDYETFRAQSDPWHHIRLFAYCQNTVSSLIDIPNRFLTGIVSAAASATMLYDTSPRLLLIMSGSLFVRDFLLSFFALTFREITRKVTQRIDDPDYCW